MKDITSLSNPELIQQTQALVLEERKLSLRIVHHLRAIEQRRLYAERGYASLYEMCLKEFGYSEGAAYRRISAMRLLKEVPEVEKKIEEGSLSLSTVSQVAGFFQAEKKQKGKSYSPEEKLELISSVEHKSKRETEVLLKTISPESARSDSERVINTSETEIRFTASEQLMQKLQRIRDLSAHSDPNPSYAELIEKMADLMLERLEKDKKPTEVIRTPSPAMQTGRSRYVPVQIRRAVWKRDGGQCTYRDPRTGKRCLSRFRLQLDHRLLCRTHNSLHAIRCFGSQKMRSFLKI